jgi:protein phosphatase
MGTSDQPAGDERPSSASTVDLPHPEPWRPTTARIEFGARTHVGRVRSNNEDQYLIARLGKSLQVLDSSLPPEAGAPPPAPEGYLMLVADGMGGAAAGERASALAVEEAKRYLLFTAKWFFSLDDPDEHVRVRLLHEGLERLDRQLIEMAEADPSLKGMGTTLTAASSIGADVFIVQVGDSRAYLFHDGHLEQLTRDQTLVQSWVEVGLLDPAAARSHRLRHVLTNSLGGSPGVRAETVKLRVADGDRLLLCTDGLTEAVSDEQIATILRLHPQPAEACQALVHAALDRGGPDNVTVVLAAYAIQEAG